MNGIKYLLDTNIVIGLLQRDLIVLEILKNKQIQIGECAYSAITRMELLSFPSITPTEKESVVFLLQRFPII
jgi:predicted nucleic acid-binding protein